MYLLKKLQKGFTIVELLIVIVVIGILATLVIVTFTGIQQRARDTQRKTDINATQSHLEAYYASTGTYPALSMVNDAAWRAANMKGLAPEALIDPGGGALAASTTSSAYGYAPLAGGSACTVTGTGASATSDCDTYTLTATLEGGGTYTKQSN